MRKVKKDNYSKIQRRLARRFNTLQDWLADPKQQLPRAWYESGNPAQGVPIEQQLPIYHPDKKQTPATLSAYLQEERQAHQGARLLSIPLYVNEHWTVLTLYFDKDNQLCSAAYIDSVVDSQENVLAENQPIPLKRNNPLYQSLQSIYPNFKEDILQYQHYVHEANASSEFAMVENAGQMVKRVYFGNRVPIRPTLWSNAPAFEEMAEELRLYITSMLDPVSRIEFSKSNERSYAVAEDQEIWKKMYRAWSRYVVPSFPDIKKPECYKTEFKRLYLTLLPHQKSLIRDAIVGRRVSYMFYDQSECRNQLLIIATCDGHIKYLENLSCSADDIVNLALCHYSYNAPNQQQVLDYFWSIVWPTQSRNHFGISLVHWAAMLNQPNELSAILQAHPVLASSVSENNITPLMCAKYFKHDACVTLLENAGGVENLHKNAATEGLYHLLSNKQLVFTTLCLILLGYGANTNFTDLPDVEFPFRDVRLSVSLRPLLAHGLDINFKIKMGSMLHLCSNFRSRVSNIIFLLAYGADPYLKNKEEETALDIAKCRGNTKNACALALAMFLKNSNEEDTPTLQGLHDYYPEYFEVLIQDILDAKSPWGWITDAMVDRLKANSLVKGFEYQKQIEFRLRRRLHTLPAKLTNPTEQLMPKAWLEDPPLNERLELQLPIYQPSRKVVYGVQGTLRSLSNYLRYEQKQHNGERLLVVPIYVKDHWAVLVLRFDKNNQPAEAHFVDSLGTEAKQLDPLYQSLRAVYLEFQGPIQQHQRYYHSDKSVSEFIMIKNAEEVIKHIYFEDRYPLTPIPWTTLSVPTFESDLPEEIRFGIISWLDLRSRMQISAMSRDNHRLSESQELWERSYQNWSRYVIPPAQA